MEIYISLIAYLFIISIGAKIFINNREKQERAILKYVILAMFLICSLRSDAVGVDTAGYKAVYEEAAVYSWSDFNYVYFESGYILLMKLFAKIDASFTVFLIAVYTIVFVPLYYFLKRYSNDVTFSLLMYICFTFFTFNLTGIRNSISLSLCLLAFLFLDRKDMKGLIGYLILLIVAFLFHKSAIIFLIALIILYAPFSLKTSIFYIMPPLLFILIPDSIFGFIGAYFGRDANLAPSLNLGGAFIFFLTIEWIAIFIIFFETIKKKKHLTGFQKEKLDMLKVSASFIYFGLLLFLFIGSSIVLIRVALFCQIFIIVLLPEILSRFEPKTRILLKILFGIFFIGHYYLTVLLPQTYDVVPYYFFWE